jgi:16S rRNA (uracil1498-N3)-methyltransferase
MKIRRRFFVALENIKGDEIVVQGQDVVHIRNVLRLGLGDTVAIFDGEGFQYRAEITSSTGDEVKCKVLSRDRVENESPIEIVLGQSILKGTKTDDIIRKSCELGVASFVPLAAQRCVLKFKAADQDKKIERWQKISTEASKQSGRAKVPSVSKTMKSVEEFCSQYVNHEIKLIFQEDENSLRFSELERGNGSIEKVALLVGPEGGWTDSEIKTAMEYGFQAVSLGPRILRAETAPIAVLSIVQFFWGDF